MLSKQELSRWIETLHDRDWVFIDDGGLTLCSLGGAYIEVGGDPEGDDEE